MIIECYRGAGDRSGSPITEPMLSDTALIERGRAEMNANAHPISEVHLDVVFRPGLRVGQLIEASDPASAAPYRARITGVQIRASPADIEATLTVERVL